MSNDKTQRSYDRLYKSLVLTEQYPIHPAGAALAIQNCDDSTTPTPAILRLYDSDDGSTWSVLPFSTTDTAGGSLSLVLGAQCYAMILFVSARKYVKIELDVESPAGVIVQLFEFMPRPHIEEESYPC